MRILTTAAQVNHELTRLLRECSSCQVAVAWASVGFDAFQLLTKHGKKITRMVVGTSFYQTHPSFIETFLTHPNVRFVLRTDGVFHPKLYFFEKHAGAWECLVGSPNFTKGGLSANDEMAVLITSEDDGAQGACESFQASVDVYWQKASALSSEELEAYRTAWKRKRPVLDCLQGKFGNPDTETIDDKGRTPLEVRHLRMTWADFFRKVKSEKDHHTIEGRLKVIRAVRQLFAEHRQFSEIDLIGRRRIAGLVEGNDINCLWFGSMKGAGKFWTAINKNYAHLSLALDLIPLTGSITREAYLEYIARYKQAFPQGRSGVATATRLLAMKRPDTFVCLASRNKKRLCDDFDIPRNVGYEAYWDSIIARVMESTWWNAARPGPGMERDVWDARAAFLDSIYYEGPI